MLLDSWENCFAILETALGLLVIMAAANDHYSYCYLIVLLVNSTRVLALSQNQSLKSLAAVD